MLRILLLGDTHIGFDHPLRPRVTRRPRGPDFVRNMRLALAPAIRGEVDLVIHSGDVFDRPKPPIEIVRLAYDPLLEVARIGRPVLVVPGNHERSRLPLPLLLAAPDLHVFRRPERWRRNVAGVRVEVFGMPFHRCVDAVALRHTLQRAEPPDPSCDVRLLLGHLAVEGAVVGIDGFTFRAGRRDVLPAGCVPDHYAALLSGHIHRRQVLRESPSGLLFDAPVVYAGSIERTSIVEREEDKGYAILRVEPGPGGGRLADVRFVDLPARPMTLLEPPGLSEPAIASWLGLELERLPEDSVVQVRLRAGARLSAGAAREVAPGSMSLRVVVPRIRVRRPYVLSRLP